MQQSVPVSGRGLPAEMDDEDAPAGSRRKRFASPHAPWWRPAGPWGRAFLAFGLLVVACTFAYAFHVCKSFLDHERAFDVQRVATVASVKLERRLGELSNAEMELILARLAERFGL